MSLERFELTRIVGAPPAAVWAIVSDFQGAMQWMPAIVRCVAETPGNVPGALRTAYIGADHWGLDRLDVIDHAAMTMTYSILESSPPFPFRGYQATIQLSAESATTTHMHWSCRYLARSGCSIDDANALIRRVYEAGFRGLDGRLGLAAA